MFNLRQLKNRLGIIGYRTVAVNRNGNGPHAEHTECHQTEGKDCRINHIGIQPLTGGKKGDYHQADHDQTFPECGEITGNNTGNNIQGSAGFTAGVDNFLNMFGF